MEIINLESILCLSSDANPFREKEREKEKNKDKTKQAKLQTALINILRDKYLPN